MEKFITAMKSLNKQLSNTLITTTTVAFRTKREKFSHKIEKVRFCKNV